VCWKVWGSQDSLSALRSTKGPLLYSSANRPEASWYRLIGEFYPHLLLQLALHLRFPPPKTLANSHRLSQQMRLVQQLSHLQQLALVFPLDDRWRTAFWGRNSFKEYYSVLAPCQCRAHESNVSGQSAMAMPSNSRWTAHTRIAPRALVTSNGMIVGLVAEKDRTWSYWSVGHSSFLSEHQSHRYPLSQYK